MSFFHPFDPPTKSRPGQEPADPADLRPAELHFAGHLHYPLRESWIVKGFQALAEAEQQGESSRVFAFPEATDRFGLGPTIVKALRFWLRATGIMSEQRGPGVRRIPLLTPLGRLLLQNDPYLEQPGSAWLLHASLVRNYALAPTFTWLFQHVASALPFTKEACIQACVSWAIKQAPDQEIRPAAIRSDLACLLQMYLPDPLHPPAPLGTTSPFRRLGLLSTLPAVPRREEGVVEAATRTPTQYQLYPPSREAVPALIVLAVLLEHGGTPVLLRDLLFAPLQIGRTFGLTQQDLLEVFQSVRAFAPAWCPTVARIGRQEWVHVPTVPVGQVLHAYYTCSCGQHR